MNDAQHAGDTLLDAWLALTSTLWNTRLVSSMTYNEAHILGILLRSKENPVPQTATDLIARTRLLKSQMNKVLTTLEKKGFVNRQRAQTDRRLVYLYLTPEGETAYRKEHSRIEALLSRLTERIGADRALHVAQEITRVTDALADIFDELKG